MALVGKNGGKVSLLLSPLQTTTSFLHTFSTSTFLIFSSSSFLTRWTSWGVNLNFPCQKFPTEILHPEFFTIDLFTPNFSTEILHLKMCTQYFPSKNVQLIFSTWPITTLVLGSSYVSSGHF